MRIHILRDDGHGTIVETVTDEKHELDFVLPGLDNEFSLLSLVDPHSYAAFGQKDMAEFLSEWDRLEERAKRPTAKPIFAEVRALAKRVQKGPGLILQFQGDLLLK